MLTAYFSASLEFLQKVKFTMNFLFVWFGELHC